MEGHWSRTYRTAKHLVDLYQASLKDKGKRVETNFAGGDGLNLSYFDMDFFEGPSDNFNCLIDYENVSIKYVTPQPGGPLTTHQLTEYM